MTRRYFFTCPIKALWMMKEFGVKITAEPHDGILNELDLLMNIEMDVRTKDIVAMKEIQFKYFIHPESEEIFEPKEGDVFSYKMFGEHRIYNLPANQTGTEWSKECTEIKIIMRDGKQFFDAERE